MALLTDQFRIFTAQRFKKSLEGPDPTQSDLDAGANRDRGITKTRHLILWILSKNSRMTILT